MDPIDQLLAKLGSSPANQPSPLTAPKSTSPETASGKSITADANLTIDDLLRSLGEPAKQTVRDQLRALPPPSASFTRSLPIPEIQSYHCPFAHSKKEKGIKTLRGKGQSHCGSLSGRGTVAR